MSFCIWGIPMMIIGMGFSAMIGIGIGIVLEKTAALKKMAPDNTEGIE